MYTENKLVKIAKRQNNNKRKYLVVNRLQGKHIPVQPKEAFSMFKSLANIIKDNYSKDKILIIGFAETATAIGAAVAVEVGSKYMQTTREIIPKVDYLFFSEEHSHATEQKLIKNDINKIINKVDRIIFVEDEVTTGNTIINIIDILQKEYSSNIKFSVASILNGMNKKSLQVYNDRKIEVHYLVKTNHDNYSEIAESYNGDGNYVPCSNENNALIKEIRIDGWMDARRLVDSIEYKYACERLWNKINDSYNFLQYNNMLVLGTEEFMYPALYIANKFQQKNIDVKCHSTTRSPIVVSSEKEYPLHVRYELKSLYDSNRSTFIYDLQKYDCVLVISDSHNNEADGLNSLVNAIKSNNNDNIFLVRWC